MEARRPNRNGKNGDEISFDPRVSLQVAIEKPVDAVLRFRVPSWAASDMPISVNQKQVAVGKPGTYQVIDRKWADGDTVEFTLPMDFRVTEYAGVDQIEGRRRYAVEYGPILLAAVGPLDAKQVATIDRAPDAVKQWLKPKAGQPLHFEIEGLATHELMPYWQIDGQPFCIFPLMGLLTHGKKTPKGSESAGARFCPRSDFLSRAYGGHPSGGGQRRAAPIQSGK